MASTVSPSPQPPSNGRLSVESLPSVDLRLLSQSELNALSLCSSPSFDLRGCDDVVIPKIDRSVFNESAGSRKQTYSRLRLAPRNTTTTTSATITKLHSLSPLPLEYDNSRIISLFKTLFNGVQRKRKRVRMNDNDVTSTRDDELLNSNGEVVDLKELGKKQDPFREEIRRRTEGKESPQELLGFISGLEGQWGSTRKKRKIVDANVFGNSLPNGWKLLIAMKKKQGRAWVFCRRYISPNGRYFVSCEEVSSYLLSLTSLDDIKKQPTVECLEDAMTKNKLASEIATDLKTKVEDPSSVTPESNDDKNAQKLLSTSQTDHGKQLSVMTNVLPREGQAASALKCHKCSTAFGEKDELLNHLLSCHKRKRRKSGAPIEYDFLMKDGKYECQFCNKVFHERSSYFGHVGIHVKNHVKSIGGSPGLIMVANQKDSAFSVAKVPITVSEAVKDVKINADFISSVPKTLASGDLNFDSTDRKPEGGCEAETLLENGEVGRNNVKVNMETAPNNKMPADESSGKIAETVHSTENTAREAEGAVDVSAMKPEEKHNDLCESLCDINARASLKLVENSKTDYASDSKQADLVTGGIVAVNILLSDREASEIDLLFENKEASSDDQDSKDRSLLDNTLEQSCFAEGLELGDNDDGLVVGSESGHLDLGIDVDDDIQCPGSLDETSDVLHMEDEAYGITAKGIEFVDSPLTESIQNSSCGPSGDQPTTDLQNFKGHNFVRMESGVEVSTCLQNSDVIVDADMSVAQEQPEARVSLQSKDNDSSYIVDEDEPVAHIKLVELGETGGFQAEQTCSLVNSPREFSSKTSKEPKSDQVMNSNLFFAPESNDRHLTADVIASNEQAHGDVSNLSGAFNNFVEDKQEEVPKNILSGLSLNQHMHEVAINNMPDAPSTTTSTQLPEQSPRTNKLIFDFGCVTDNNSRFLGPVQNETVLEGSSPFSLWGEQTCTVEDNQNRVYSSARGASQQQRSSDSNSLNLIGLQQPLDVGYNLNKVCMNEQRYSVQRNETDVYRKTNDIERECIYGRARGFVQQESASDNNLLNLVGLQQPSDAGFNLNKIHLNDQRYGVQHNESSVYRKNNEARTERVSHGNTLNLAGFQQQCDTGYNLNKSCTSQQSYGMQCNETGAYSTSDESKQERVTYGNSLSLASVPPTCEPRYAMKKACIPQTCDTGFSLNRGYMGTMQGFSKLDELGHSRDRDLMVGFGNSDGRPNQNVATDLLWRPTEGNILPGGLMDSSSSRQPSGSYQAFDFLSDKGGNNLYAANENYGNISSFQGMRSTNVELMEFSFMTSQDSNSHLGHKNVLPFNAQINHGYGSSVWHQKPTLPNMMTGHVVSTLCVWCGNEFHQDSLNIEIQAGSIGSLCPTCKARMSGQFL